MACLGLDMVCTRYKSTKSDKIYKFKIWDTPGLERFKSFSFSKIINKHTDASIIAFHIHDIDYIKSIEFYLEALKS